jgi:hypothetical protein
MTSSFFVSSKRLTQSPKPDKLKKVDASSDATPKTTEEEPAKTWVTACFWNG